MRAERVVLATILICLPISVDAQQFPDGPGKDILEKQCSTCHAPEMATTFRRSAEEWQEVIANMRDLGAELTDDQAPVLLGYLTKHWGLGAGAPPPVAAPASTAAPQDMPADYQQVLASLGRQGDFKDRVLRVNIPRNDLNVSVDGIATPTAFGFGGWVALTKGTGGMDVMMGDLVLTEREVDAVMSALLNEGLAVTALHNHFFFETPRIFYMHVHGHGRAVEIADQLKPALALIGKAVQPTVSARAGKPLEGKLNTAALAKSIGTPGESTGAVYKITIGRPEIKITELGAPINSRMGLNTWAAFYGSDADAIVAGDVAMLDSEVQPVLKALRSNGISIVAIHHHMIGTTPNVTFLHYWGRGPAQKLAAGVRAAIDQLANSTR